MTERFEVVLRDPEEAIDRVLVGLREVEASPGMEGRVMEALEARVVAQDAATFGEKRWRGAVVRLFTGRWAALPGMGGGRLAFGLVLLGLLVAGGVISVSRGVRRGVLVSRAAARGSNRLRGSGSRESGRAGGLGEAVAGGRGVPGSGEAVLSGRLSVNSPARKGRVAGKDELAREIAGAAGGGGVARGRLRLGDERASVAVSFPAPPLPLTEQERLLLRVVHRGDTQELAMLNPAVRRAREAADAAEYQEFFRPPEPLAGNTAPRE